ncbi:MAG: ABC transporter permease [Meiothermus sp.]|uniref:ABC transporter permease n=1 Tax=Meiothermus sp. TaxID=1955249 RepID=UPI0025D8703B|nr:ABC transporter permease [Meiothermus sp.]MCS7195012.1 ABC transporter permease [Meiothermus sp.]MDW8089904.1 ABC transporter permease [Meiothermus sp.]
MNPSTPWTPLLKALLRNRSALIGGLITLTVLLGALLAPLIAPWDPLRFDPPNRLSGPSPEHWLGTDQYGRDLFSRVLFGARFSLSVAAVSVLAGLLVGGSLGLLAGYFRGGFDLVISRLADILIAYPAILLAIAFLAFLGGGFANLVLAISVVFVGPFIRVARAAALMVREEPYVEAAQAMGASHTRIILRTILPNAAAPLIVEATLRFAYAVLAEAALSFLGLGIQPPFPALGSMVSEGRAFLSLSPWGSLVPGFAIVLMVLGFNLLGDGLRDALDPRLRRL